MASDKPWIRDVRHPDFDLDDPRHLPHCRWCNERIYAIQMAGGTAWVHVKGEFRCNTKAEPK